MLSVSKITGNAGGVDKYCRHRSQEHAARDSTEYTTGYYADEAPSQWRGALAAEFGLDGPVEADDFKALLDGTDPATGEGLTKNAGSDGRRLGNDLTFSAPKSVSLEALANGAPAAREAHDRAVNRALEYVESSVISARYGKGGADSERSGNAAIATFQHEDARTVDDRVDPGLHTHCIALNLTRGRDGKLRSVDLDFGANSVRMHTADMIYKAELAAELQRAGYEIRQTAHGFELGHITDEQIAAFSRRRDQIDVALDERGTSRADASAAQRSAANQATRGQKSQAPRSQQLSDWHRAGREAGLTRGAADGTDRRANEPSGARAAVDLALAHLGERSSVIDREAALLEAMRNGIGRVGADAIKRSLDSHEQVYQTDAGLVTQGALDREARILAAARRGRGTQAAMHGDAGAAAAAADHHAADRSMVYTEGQRQAITNTLTSTDQTAGIVGAAGAGKTTALRAIADEARRAGYDVHGLAPSAAAADALTDAGADKTETIAAHVMRDQQPGNDDRPRLLLMDEAGMVSARDLDRVMARLDDRDRLLLIGDPDQLQAVEAGAPFAQMMAEKAINVSTISEVRRQRDPELRKIAQAFAQGDAAAGVDRALAYAGEVDPMPRDDGKITKTEKRAAIAEQAAARYLELDEDARSRTLMLSGTNEVRASINERVRETLTERGEIDTAQSVDITALKKSDLTRAQRSQARHYEAGQVMRMAGRGGARDYTIETVDTARNEITMRDRETGGTRTERVDALDPRRARLYDTEAGTLAVGERVIFTENDRHTETKNGMTGRVIAAGNGRAQVQTDGNGGRVIDLDASRPVAVDSAYCRTVHKAQGATSDRVIVAGEGSRTATAEQAYVACSRQRDHLEIVTDSTEALGKRWTKYADRTTARDAMRRTRSSDPMQQARSQERERHEMSPPAQERTRPGAEEGRPEAQERTRLEVERPTAERPAYQPKPAERTPQHERGRGLDGPERG